MLHPFKTAHSPFNNCKQILLERFNTLLKNLIQLIIFPKPPRSSSETLDKVSFSWVTIGITWWRLRFMVNIDSLTLSVVNSLKAPHWYSWHRLRADLLHHKTAPERGKLSSTDQFVVDQTSPLPRIWERKWAKLKSHSPNSSWFWIPPIPRRPWWRLLTSDSCACIAVDCSSEWSHLGALPMAFLVPNDSEPGQIFKLTALWQRVPIFNNDIRYLDLSFVNSSGKVDTAVVSFCNTFARVQ